MPRRVDRLRKETRISRTPSDLLSDLHVYILPQDKWIPFRRLARNTVVEETVSAGFVRVLPDVTLVDLRQELTGQLGDDVPEHYVFIKSVGRNFTQVKPHQEQMVKAKNFLPPHAEEPEIHIMELSEELLRYAPSLSNLLASDTELSESFGPSRLTQRETYARAENLRSWAENAEGKWEGPSSDVNGDSLSAPGIKATDRYNLDSNIIIHWQSQEDGEEEREADETRDRGDGMSDNRERRRSIEGDDEGASEEGSSDTSEEEDQEARAARRNRRNREKRGGGGGGGDRRKAKNGVAGGRTGANENRRGNVGGKDDNADNNDDGDEDGKSEGEGKRKAETESDEKGMDERSGETGDEGGKKRANKALHKANSKSQLKKRHKGNRKGAAADGNSEERSEDDDDEETTDKTMKPKDSKARHVTGRGGGGEGDKSDVEAEGEDERGGGEGGGGGADVRTVKKREEVSEQKINVREREGADGGDEGERDGDAEKGQNGEQDQRGEEADENEDESKRKPAKTRPLREADGDAVEINGIDGDSEKNDDEEMGRKERLRNRNADSDGNRDNDENRYNDRIDTGNSEREGAENSAGSLDESNFGRNIYARAENGDMVRIKLTAGGETSTSGGQEESAPRDQGNKKGGKASDGKNSNNNNNNNSDDQKAAKTMQGKRKHGDTDSTPKGPNRSNATKIKTKAVKGGDVGVAKEKVGGAERGRARARRRNTRGSVTDSEGDADGPGQSRRNRVLKSTKFWSTQVLTRSASASQVTDLGSYAENLAGDKDRGPKVKRSASEERLGYDPWLYAPHKWYYARIARPLSGEEESDDTSSGELEDREARLKALEAKKQASLDDGGSVEGLGPGVDILSMEGPLGGPLASLQEGVISGFQINSEDVDTNENPLGASRDHLTLTYELQVDETGSRITQIGRVPGDGKGAWESEEDGGGSPSGLRADADEEDASAVTDDSDGARRRKKGAKQSRGKSQDRATQEKISGRLAQVLKEKAEAEEMRQKLFSQAKDLHEEILRVKEKRREKWWKQYNDSRKIGTQLEERQSAYRNELDSLHRKIIGSIIRRQPLVTGVRDEPSRKANYKISIIRLRHEVEDLRRRVEAMDIKVETEVRLRNQAERELKTLRQEVSRKKANMAISQSRASLLRTATNFPTDLLVRM